MPENERWVDELERDLRALAKGRSPARRAAPPTETFVEVKLRLAFAEPPAFGPLADYIADLDLAFRRSAYALRHDLSLEELLYEPPRLPRRDGLRLIDAKPGSLFLEVFVPLTILGAIWLKPQRGLAAMVAHLSRGRALEVDLSERDLPGAAGAPVATEPPLPAPEPTPEERPREGDQQFGYKVAPEAFREPVPQGQGPDPVPPDRMTIGSVSPRSQQPNGQLSLKTTKREIVLRWGPPGRTRF